MSLWITPRRLSAESGIALLLFFVVSVSLRRASRRRFCSWEYSRCSFPVSVRDYRGHFVGDPAAAAMQRRRCRGVGSSTTAGAARSSPVAVGRPSAGSTAVRGRRKEWKPTSRRRSPLAEGER